MTQGEFIDSMTLDEIINHPQFYSLTIERGINSKDYWKITFESDKRSASGRWLSLSGAEILHKHFIYYKIKQ